MCLAPDTVFAPMVLYPAGLFIYIAHSSAANLVLVLLLMEYWLAIGLLLKGNPPAHMRMADIGTHAFNAAYVRKNIRIPVRGKQQLFHDSVDARRTKCDAVRIPRHFSHRKYLLYLDGCCETSRAENGAQLTEKKRAVKARFWFEKIFA